MWQRERWREGRKFEGEKNILMERVRGEEGGMHSRVGPKHHMNPQTSNSMFTIYLSIVPFCFPSVSKYTTN